MWHHCNKCGKLLNPCSLLPASYRSQNPNSSRLPDTMMSFPGMDTSCLNKPDNLYVITQFLFFISGILTSCIQLLCVFKPFADVQSLYASLHFHLPLPSISFYKAFSLQFPSLSPVSLLSPLFISLLLCSMHVAESLQQDSAMWEHHLYSINTPCL